MTDKAKKARNEYMKEYRKKNKDKIKMYQQGYWERKGQQNKGRK